MIDGAPGVGKTALALHWAHRVRSHYPDGDLYVNMRSHGPGPRLDALAALGALLQALGVPADGIPLDLDSRAALYRTLLDRKRVLVLIDDAVSPAQVRPLLPGSPSCRVLITSRSTLAGLVTREGARRMDLSTLTAEESLALLRANLGDARMDAEPEAALALVSHCAHLPLALRVLAELLSSRPGSALNDVAAELAAEHERLDTLITPEDELSDIRAVFAASYTALPTESARLFRSLGAHPGPDFSVAACAAGASLSLRRARTIVDGLARANLVQRTGHERYRIHDLLRAYATERLDDEEPVGEADTVLGRVTRWYLRTATNAVLAWAPAFRPVEIPGEDSSVDAANFDEPAAALSWFEQERPNLVRAVQAAFDRGMHDLAWRIPANTSGLFEIHRHWHEWRGIQQVGLESARILGHSEGQARNHLACATVNLLLDDAEAALEHYTAAQDFAREAGSPWIEGFALRRLGALRWERDGDTEGLDLIDRAIAAFRAAHDRRGEGMALLSLAEYERSIDRTDAALEHCRTAISLFAETGEPLSGAYGRSSLARVLTDTGSHTDAVGAYAEALEVFRSLEDRDSEAAALTGMGRAYATLGDNGKARHHLGAALDILRSFEDPRAADVETAIGRLGAPEDTGETGDTL
ncbi:tetratricopeptide repeat protein [Streptomonospora wellingtoniae]|uniref:NB-ARC domain-containing protein n=1 Tax=Streptomonospora wellingtoniae TaxID=3075544 RepID=A0ABU2L102_9ACTN|nr:tetratricopeptide repeat protein [Streptomonospora sp. DSM 45055]MDT0305023.1 NB-ARC domain-containing protein [Streptomonospora sp. DSM 45055]